MYFWSGETHDAYLVALQPIIKAMDYS